MRSKANKGVCALALLALASGSMARAQFAEPGFEDVLYTGSLSEPTAMAFAPDGWLFVTQQAGALRVIDPSGALQPQPFLQVSVISSSERGLLGVAFDPGYVANGHVYIYYTSSATGLNTISRFTRNIASPLTADPNSELKILEVASANGYHNGGALHFGTDGMLYVGVGDAHTSSNAQTLGNLLGKILRIDPRSYPNIVPADNPFVSTPGARGEIWAYGLRNPFTFAVHPQSGRTHINDVGQSSWEEINVGALGANFGWPTCEGACSNPSYVDPLHAYGHSDGCAITGGDFYTGTAFPPAMREGYFFADYCSGWIRRLDSGGQAHDFLSGLRNVVDIKQGPDDALYYLDRGPRQVRRIRYVGSGNQAPTAVATASPSSGAAPLDVELRGDQSSDPDGDALTYSWDLGDGNAASGAVVNHTYATAGSYDAVLTVDDGNGGSDTDTVTVTVGTRPVATIVRPAEGTLYSGGETIFYEGSATDAEDGTLPASAFSWTIAFHHDDHTHPHEGPIDGVRSGSFTIPTVGETSANVWYRIHLTVTDSSGLTDSVYRDVRPRTAVLSFATVPAGLQVTLDGQPRATPFAVTGVVGIERQIGAPSPQQANGSTWVFVSWSDGGAREHTIVTPTGDTTYTATYREESPPAPVENHRRSDTQP